MVENVSNNGAISLKTFNVKQMKRIEIRDVGIVFVKQQRIQDSLMARKQDNIDPTKGKKIFFKYLIDFSTLFHSKKTYACS